MAADRSTISGGLYMTEEQYLALDEATDANYEFYDGYVIMLRPPSSAYDARPVLDMAGGSLAHAALCVRIASLLDQSLLNSDSPCMAYSSDVKLKLAAEHNYFHPDVSVACGEESGNMLTRPVVVIEMLSSATEKRDRGAKFKVYKALPTVQEYMLVGSEYKAIEVHRREGNFWRQYHYREGDLIELTSIGVSFPFDDVYRRITLA